MDISVRYSCGMVYFDLYTVMYVSGQVREWQYLLALAIKLNYYYYYAPIIGGKN